MAAKVADQREIRRVAIRARIFARVVRLLQRLPRIFRQREVVMDAGDRLHAPAVPMRQALPVDGLRAPEVRPSVARERNLVVRRQPAGHARAPQDFAVEMPIDELMQFGQLAHAGVGVDVHAGDQLDLRLAEVGGDVRMRQRGTERDRMRLLRQVPVGPRAQAFLLDAAAQCAEHLRIEGSQAPLQRSVRLPGRVSARRDDRCIATTRQAGLWGIR